MERAIDKLTTFALCVFLAALRAFSPLMIAAALVSISVSALFDVDTLPRQLRAMALLAYVAASALSVDFLLFLPVVSNDCYRLDALLDDLAAEAKWVLRLSWLAAVLAGLLREAVAVAVVVSLLGGLACLRAWQSRRLADELDANQARRDELSALSQSLELRNRDLEERQSLQLRLATMAERSRIAREIHDNVGHLLTRSVLQVEALQVEAQQMLSGQQSEQLGARLSGVSETLREAYESVRESVHGLYDEAFELQLQLEALARETESLPRAQGSGLPISVRLDYEVADAPPQAISYSLLAIVREALANSLKHSDASEISVSLKEFPAFYQLTVKDNGSQAPAAAVAAGGSGTAPTAASPGIGLASMQERARALGGLLHTSWEKGFKVFATIPKEQ